MQKDTKKYRHDRAQRLALARQDEQREIGEVIELVTARETINPENFLEEANVNSSAYINYRFQPAYRRTEQFANTYQQIYGRHQLLDKGRAGKRIKDRSLTSFSVREISGFWQARRHADALGMPYDRYVQAAFSYAHEHGWTKIPAPNQLYTPEVLSAVQDHWVKIQREGRVDLLPHDCDPRFFAENYIGDKVQVEALDAIQSEIERAPAPQQARMLCRYMRERRLFPEVEARARLGDWLVDEALSERLINAVRPDGLIAGIEPSNPGCFGMPEQSNPICMQCPVSSACGSRADKVERKMLELFGAVDARAQHQRELARERKRRQRALDRSGATMTLQEQKRMLRWLGDRKGPKPIPKGRGKAVAPEAPEIPEGPG